MATEDLLQQLDDAVEQGVWDRRCQFVGATVAYRAVKEAAESLEIQKKALNGGVSKAEVVDWIQGSARFKNWSIIMQGKLEVKSYQSSISKAMTRAGYERVDKKNFGRFVRYTIPSGTKIHPEARNSDPSANETTIDEAENKGDAAKVAEADGGKNTKDDQEEDDAPDGNEEEEAHGSNTLDSDAPKPPESDNAGDEAKDD